MLNLASRATALSPQARRANSDLHSAADCHQVRIVVVSSRYSKKFKLILTFVISRVFGICEVLKIRPSFIVS